MSGSELLLPDEMTMRGAGEALAARLQVEDGVHSRARPHLLRHVRPVAAGCRSDCDARGRDAIDLLAGLRGGGCLTPDAGAGEAAVRARAAVRSSAGHAASDHRCPGVVAAGPIAQLASACCPCSTTNARRSSASHSRRPSLLRSDGAEAALRPRLRITGIRGYDKDLGRVQEALVDELGFKPADQPLIDEAVRAAGGVPGGLPTKVGLPLDTRSAVGRCRRRRATRDARGDRGEPRWHDRRPRQRVPARPQGVGPALALGSARAQDRFPARRSRALPWPSSAGSSRSPAMSATSMFTCSSSTRCGRSCPSRCGAI